MSVEVLPLGGYGEVGKNMTAIKIDDKVVIFDCGLHLPNYIRLTDDDDVVKLSAHLLRKEEAIPDDRPLMKWKDKVVAIVSTHAHLDHIGALPYLAAQYDVPIIGTPFTLAVLKRILNDEKIELPNKFIYLKPNDSYNLAEDLRLEFVNMTHSTPQTVMIALRTRYGAIVYGLDYKLDNHPVIGEKPDYRKIDALGKDGVLLFIANTLYAWDQEKCPSESIAREMLKDVMEGTRTRGNAVIVTTFASHLARLKSIIEFGKKMGRKVIFLGRSLAKYSLAGSDAGIIDFEKDVEIFSYSAQIRRKLRQIEKEGTRDKYLFVVTGHQGEPKATLSKMAHGILPFNFHSEDIVIFSCKVIPTKINQDQREFLEKQLRNYGVRIFSDIHVSGHGAREDLHELIHRLCPAHIIPAHADAKGTQAAITLAEERGYTIGETCHQVSLGKVFNVPLD